MSVRKSNPDVAAIAYRGRFAPSPTGPLHFGSLVAAIGSFLEARSRGGQWLVRMEDLDTPRVEPGAADAILRALEAFELHWDGSVLRQSDRHGVYHENFERLRRHGLLYVCVCSRKEIADSAVQGIDGPVYPGTCRDARHTFGAWRVQVSAVDVSFEDRVQGGHCHRLDRDIGDFVLRRADGLFTYQLACVVDDGVQGVTDIVRGADLLDSTSRQLYLQSLLELPHPTYAHLPVALNALGQKLSKQTLAPAIDARAASRLWCKVLSFLGQAPPCSLEQESVRQIKDWAIENWSLARVARERGRAVDLH